MLGDLALDKLLTLSWRHCLDLGSGRGHHARTMRDAGRLVTTLDGDFRHGADVSIAYPLWRPFQRQFDAVWCCHVLEHQRNAGWFLDALWHDVSPGGYLAITVPPRRNYHVPGHVSEWTAGLLLYNLVLAGFDCLDAMVKTYGYNISVIVQRQASRVLADQSMLLTEMRQYFPVPLTGERPELGALPAEIVSVNW